MSEFPASRSVSWAGTRPSSCEPMTVVNGYEYGFDATMSEYDFGRMAYTIVYLPASTKRRLPLAEYPRLRIDGEINGVRFRGAVQPAGDGQYYLLLSKAFLKSAGLALGDRTLVAFDIADQEAVDVPVELEFALEANETAAAVWNRITAGKRRGLAHRVSSAKRVSTREARVEEVIDELCRMAETDA